MKKQNLTTTMLHGRTSYGRAPLDLAAASIEDGGITAKHTVFGIVILAGCVLAANALTLLRPAFY